MGRRGRSLTRSEPFRRPTMGCGGSAYAMKNPNFHVANGGCTRAMGEITSARTGYVLKAEALGYKANSPWSAYFVREGGAGKILDIRDHTGRVVYQILPHGAGAVNGQNYTENTLLRNKMHIMKAGEPHTSSSRLACGVRRPKKPVGSGCRRVRAACRGCVP